MNHSLGFCHVILWLLFQIDTRMSQWQGMFLRVKHAWTCLLRVLATGDFHATVAKGNEEALEPSQQTGFQQPGFWITTVGFRIPKPWIPDSTDQNYLDSGLRITLHGAKTNKQTWWKQLRTLNLSSICSMALEEAQPRVAGQNPSVPH